MRKAKVAISTTRVVLEKGKYLVSCWLQKTPEKPATFRLRVKEGNIPRDIRLPDSSPMVVDLRSESGTVLETLYVNLLSADRCRLRSLEGVSTSNEDLQRVGNVLVRLSWESIGLPVTADTLLTSVYWRPDSVLRRSSDVPAFPLVHPVECELLSAVLVLVPFSNACAELFRHVTTNLVDSCQALISCTSIIEWSLLMNSTVGCSF